MRKWENKQDVKDFVIEEVLKFGEKHYDNKTTSKKTSRKSNKAHEKLICIHLSDMVATK